MICLLLGRTHKPLLSRPFIVRHGEELIRFGLKANLKLTGKWLSGEVCRIECVVYYERGAGVWERLRTSQYLYQNGMQSLTL